jgi:hypothetical protein
MGCDAHRAPLQHAAAGGRFFFLTKMKPPGAEAPIVLVKWYAYAKWVLERVAGFPKSEADEPFYTGMTSDLRRRFEEHNAGQVASTKHRLPFRLVYYEACVSQPPFPRPPVRPPALSTALTSKAIS